MHEMILHSVCDLVGLANKFNENIKGFDIAAKVISKIETPPAFRSKCGDDVDWVRCGMLWTNVRKSYVNLSAKSIELKTFVQDNYKKTHFLFGCIDIAVPRGTVVNAEGNILMPYIKVQGTISADRYNKAHLYMQSWLFDNGKYIFKPTTVTTLDVEGESEAVKTVFFNAVNGGMARLVVRLKVFDTDRLVQAGTTYKGPITCVELTRETRVIVDDNGMITERVQEQTVGMTNIFKPVEEQQLTFSDMPTNPVVPVVKAPDIMPPADEKGKCVWHGRTYYNREQFYDNAPFTEALGRKLETARAKVQRIVKALENYSYYDYADVKSALIMALNRGYNVKAGDGIGVTGRHLLHAVLEKALNLGYFGSITSTDIAQYNAGVQQNYYGGTIKCTKKDMNDLYAHITENSTNALDFLTIWAIPDVNKVPVLYLPLYLRSAQLVYLFIAEILRIRSDLTPLMDCSGSVLGLIADNPYNLGFLDSSISISDMDKLAMLFNTFNKASVRDSRCVAFMHSIMTDENNRVIDSSTCVVREKLEKRLKYGYEVNKMLEKQLTCNPGYAVSKGMLVNAQTYLQPLYMEESFRLPSREKTLMGTKLYYHMDGDICKAIVTYVDSGLGVAFNSVGGKPCVCDYTLLSKEFEIHKFCKNLAEQPIVHYESEMKESLLAEFESTKGFKLEAKQKEAFLADTNVLAIVGAAGTGKTTTAEAILYRLQMLENIADDEIVFLAPTGCAANCLKASVKRKAYTIHSKLCIGVEVHRGIAEYSKESEWLNAKVVVVDECSMITVDLMHKLLSHIDRTKTKVYFLGDIAQLPPIGLGKPFANMLNYLPCITLNVSKRATEGSMITYNANALLDSTNDSIVEGDDFKLMSATTNTVQAEILKYYKHYTGIEPCPGLPLIEGITKDDVQVVSPLRKEKHTWGTDALNALLRDIANPITRETQSITYLEDGVEHTYRTGDRVIHLKNHPTALRFVEQGNNNFVQMSTEDFGVMNGDIGKIYKFVDGETLNLICADNEGMLDMSMTAANKDLMYMFVEYADIDISDGSPIKYLIAYPLHKYMVDNKVFIDVTDLQEISLAYALTAHKMQGSASKVIIAPLFDLATGDFLNNNMLYTMITRASKLCILLGDVVGNYNVISRIRKIFILDKRKSIFDNY